MPLTKNMWLNLELWMWIEIDIWVLQILIELQDNGSSFKIWISGPTKARVVPHRVIDLNTFFFYQHYRLCLYLCFFFLVVGNRPHPWYSALFSNESCHGDSWCSWMQEENTSKIPANDNCMNYNLYLLRVIFVGCS